MTKPDFDNEYKLLTREYWSIIESFPDTQFRCLYEQYACIPCSRRISIVHSKQLRSFESKQSSKAFPPVTVVGPKLVHNGVDTLSKKVRLDLVDFSNGFKTFQISKGQLVEHDVKYRPIRIGRPKIPEDASVPVGNENSPRNRIPEKAKNEIVRSTVSVEKSKIKESELKWIEAEMGKEETISPAAMDWWNLMINCNGKLSDGRIVTIDRVVWSESEESLMIHVHAEDGDEFAVYSESFVSISCFGDDCRRDCAEVKSDCAFEKEDDVEHSDLYRTRVEKRSRDDDMVDSDGESNKIHPGMTWGGNRRKLAKMGENSLSGMKLRPRHMIMVDQEPHDWIDEEEKFQLFE